MKYLIKIKKNFFFAELVKKIYEKKLKLVKEELLKCFFIYFSKLIKKTWMQTLFTTLQHIMYKSIG